MPAPNSDIKKQIREEAQKIGFDAIGFTTADLPPDAKKRLVEFLELGRHGDMEWLSNRSAQRAHPKALWPEASSVIMLGLNYGPGEDPMIKLDKRGIGNISVYAQNKDYHDIVKKRLKRLARMIAEQHRADVKVFVDTAPVMEKPLAERAGLGWQGKHTNLVSRDYGSWLFLGAIFTSLPLVADSPSKDHCGACQNCLGICPTKAFPAPYQLDARRCISYLTIEYNGPIPVEFRESMGNRIYGCDDCLAVCPWNKFAQLSKEAEFHARDELSAPSLAILAALDDAAFRKLFSKSPVKRTGRNRFIRNVLIAISNSDDKSLLPTVCNLLDDDDASVRGAAVWALHKLDPAGFGGLMSEYASAESNAQVVEEWRIGAERLSNRRNT